MRIFLYLGSRRGYAALNTLLALQAKIVGILCLVEDLHEPQYHEKITLIAKLHHIPIFYTTQVKPLHYHEVVRKCAPDIAFAIGWRFLINQPAYTIPCKGTLVIHDSLLPKYRGFAPMNWAIINGETETGVTLFFIAETVDSGPIVDQLKISINIDDTAASVDERIIFLYEQIIIKNLSALENNTYHTHTQDEAAATFTCKRTPEDGLINWHQSALHIHNLVRGTSAPFPGAFTYLNHQRIIIWKTRLPIIKRHYVGVIPGRLLGKYEGMIEVLTADGILQIEQLQVDHQAIIEAKDFNVSVKETFR